MRQTPRSLRASRNIGTLIGNGWLRESARNAGWPAKWDPRSKSALRKCMFMPVPEELRRLMPPVSQAAMVPQKARPATPPEEIVPHRRNPAKDAREFPMYVPRANANASVDPRVVAAQAHAIHVHNAQKVAAAAANKTRPAVWWEDPVALGSLLILVPPIGLAAVWSSKRYTSDARWALTIMTALTMCLMSAILIAVLLMR